MSDIATTFFPIVSTFVPADTGYNPNGKNYHPDNTKYKVSIGYEIEDANDNYLVFKTQICHDGKISGRKSPSFPILSKDWEEVKNAMDKVYNFYTANSNKALRNCII